jgi:hypothetical protein
MEAFAHRKRDIDLFRIERYATRDKGDLIESVCAARTPADPDLQARLLPGNCFSGFDLALFQGVFTPMVGGVR